MSSATLPREQAVPSQRTHLQERAVPHGRTPRPLRPRLAVVVLTQCDRPAELRRAVASVRAQQGVSPEVVLVVNGAQPPEADLSDRLVVLPENVGVPDGRNIGVAATDAEVVFFLDDDAELQGVDHLATVLGRFDADPDLGAMAMRIVDETGRSQRRHVPRVGRRSAHRSGHVTHFIGAACAVRASAFDEIDGFDDRFFYAMEESDLAWRLQDRGWGIWYSADLTAFHPRTAPSRHSKYMWFLARNRFWMAWRSLPLVLFLAHMLTWTTVCAVRRQPLRDVFAGYREAWATRPERRPMRWRTVARMTRLGRPPFV